jgi:replication factor C subunit 1
MEGKLESFLNQFEKNKHDFTILRCAYVFGPSGSGKTRFVHSTLKNMNYDVVSYNASDVRNKSIIENINMSSSNVMSLLTQARAPKKIAIVMDEIECMNNGTRGGSMR